MAEPPTTEDIFRYRYQHGTNLGSMFVHGPWLNGGASGKDAGASKELEEVKSALKSTGLERTRLEWESHWQTALTDDDLAWLKDTARCNSIRIPIGFFTLGPVFCAGTEFEGEPAEVYANCWNILKRLIEKCYHHGIGVLVDFQTIPGSMDEASHGNPSTADYCASGRNWELATDCVAFIVQEVTYHAMTGVVGVQISSETDWETCDLRKWYDEVLEITSCVNPPLPIYISDGNNLPEALGYAMQKNRLPIPIGRSPIIVDTHKYYTTGSYQHMDPTTITSQLSNSLSDLPPRQGQVSAQKTAVEAYIGQYSCALDTRTWDRVDPSDRPALTKAFGHAQSKQWQTQTCGSAFVGFKVHRTNGGDWNFEHQIKTGALRTPPWLTVPRTQVLSSISHAEAQRQQSREKALSQHSQSHHFAVGWDLGFSDALAFFGALARNHVPGEWDGGEKIGALELWIRKRIVDTKQLSGGHASEWETGFRRGVEDLHGLVGLFDCQ
ncbi:glycoside hydrolase [Aspergillus avenaceus]|uniref:Glycoside hydrolase n=1 Tax=Aspergillus avenaceus TaxID=36643 RepID=A0A5N6TK07_ASPAV|nr:glycoside hydrolase [Aspergillus avenaceus]